MLPLRTTNIAAIGRVRFFWVGVAAVVVAQLAAFWMLCRQQVLDAQAREAVVQVQRVAMADCLRHLPRATSSSCAWTSPAEHESGNAVMTAAEAALRGSTSAAMPVGFTLR
jgi:hypothetical protein